MKPCSAGGTGCHSRSTTDPGDEGIDVPVVALQQIPGFVTQRQDGATTVDEDVYGANV